MKYNKKIIGIFLIVCVAMTFLATVSATEVTISGEKFIIPDEFEEEKDTSMVNKDSTGTTETKCYVHNMDYITITISTINNGASGFPIDDDYKNKTINGTEGLYKVDEYGNEEFVYLNNQKTIYITLTPGTSDKVPFEDIIIENYKEESSSPFDFF